MWTSILSDDDFDCSTQPGRERLARFVWIGAYSALHGERGKTDVEKGFLLSRLGMQDVSQLEAMLARKNVVFEEGKNRHGKITVTLNKWVKFQEDSTQAERARASRSKRREEERRREETRKEESSGGKSRAVKFPENFIVTDQIRELAKQRGWPALDAELEAFRDFHVSRGSTFKDWEAAFRTWLRNSRRFGARSGNSGADGPPDLRTPTERLAAREKGK